MKDVLRKWLSLSYVWLDNPLMRREHTWDENCNEWGQNHGLEQREKEPSPWKRRISYDIQLWDVFQRYQKRCREGEGEVPTLRKNSGDKEKDFGKPREGGTLGSLQLIARRVGGSCHSCGPSSIQVCDSHRIGCEFLYWSHV